MPLAFTWSLLHPWVSLSASVSSLGSVVSFHEVMLPQPMYGSGSFACANKRYVHRLRYATLSGSPLCLLPFASHGKHINPQITSEPHYGQTASPAGMRQLSVKNIIVENTHKEVDSSSVEALIRIPLNKWMIPVVLCNPQLQIHPHPEYRVQDNSEYGNHITQRSKFYIC